MPKPAESDLAPLYAVAGLADIIAETLRESVAARQRKAEERVAAIRDRRLERVEQARVNADELREFLSTLPEQFRALPGSTRIRLAELQRQTEELLAQAGDTYSSLAGRGKRVVDERVGDVRGAGRKAKEAAEEGLDGAAETVEPLVDQAQEAVTEVRRNVTGRAARTRRTTEPVDDVTPESATRAARKAAAAAGAGISTTPTDLGDAGPAQALAQERAAKKTAKKAPVQRAAAKKTAPAPTATVSTAPTPAKKAAAKKVAAKKAGPAPSAPTPSTPTPSTPTVQPDDQVDGPGTAS